MSFKTVACEKIHMPAAASFNSVKLGHVWKYERLQTHKVNAKMVFCIIYTNMKVLFWSYEIYRVSESCEHLWYSENR